MLRAGTSCSRILDGEKAAESAVRCALEKSGISKAEAVLLFTSSEHYPSYSKILRKIQALTGTDNIIGTSGRGILTEDLEVERRHSLAVMVLGSSDEFQTQPFMLSNLQESNFRAGEQAGNLLRQNGFQAQSLLLFADPFSFQSSLFFDGFETAYGYVPILGGAAGENGKEDRTLQICGQQVAFDAACGLALGGDLRMEVGIARSCRPIGESFQITRADGNMIYEMDGRPAYDIFLESISQIEFQDPEEILQHIFLGMPVRSYQTDFEQVPYLIRNIMGVNAKKGMLACIAPVEEGNFVTFTMRNPELAHIDMKNMLDELKMRVNGSEIAAGFYFNCCARGEMLYGKKNHDTSLIKEYFPDVPLLGFFSYGEIAPLDHVNHLHQHSGVLALLVR